MLHVTGLEEDRLPPRLVLNVTFLLGPGLEGFSGKVGQELVSMDAEHLLEKPAVRPHAIHDVGRTQAGARERPRRVRISEHAIS